MMTKTELSRLSLISKEINIIKKQIDSTRPEAINSDRILTDKVSGSSAVFPYCARSFTVSGTQQYDYDKYYAKLGRLQKQLSDKLEELMDERDRITNYINSLDEPIIRMILMCKYVNCMTWEQIGREVGFSSMSVRRKHRTYFKKDV